MADKKEIAADNLLSSPLRTGYQWQFLPCGCNARYRQIDGRAAEVDCGSMLDPWLQR